MSPAKLLPSLLATFSQARAAFTHNYGHVGSRIIRPVVLRGKPPAGVLSPPSALLFSSTEEEAQMADAVVVGGGPAGLLSGIMLAKEFPGKKVKIFDRLSAPPSPTDETVWSDVAKFYLIGLGGRGQSALAEFGVWEEVKACCVAVNGRKDWAPGAAADEGVERIFTDRPVTTQVLPRDKLCGVLHQHILNQYAGQIELNYGYEVTPIDFDHDDGSLVLMRVSKCERDPRINPITVNAPLQEDPEALCDVDDYLTLVSPLLVAADGTARTVGSAMESADKANWDALSWVEKLRAGKPFTITRYVDDNQRIYKTVPMKLPAGWRFDLNYSARSKDGRLNFDALPADANGNYCGVLLLMKDDPLAQPRSDPAELRKLFDELLPQFGALLDKRMMDSIAKKGPSYLPSFRYAGPRLHQGDRTVILGDCAHTVKPYFGLGANSALEDVQVLGDALRSTASIKDAVHLFSKQRAGEAEALVKLSRELDRPGKLGFLTFVLPLILDSIFHGIAPKVFAPNIIAMLQKKGIDFRGVRRRKRLDRFAQVCILGSTSAVLVKGAEALMSALTKASGLGDAEVVSGLVISAVAVFMLRKLASFLVPGMAPADVLNKTQDKVTSSDSFLTPLGMKGNSDEQPEENVAGAGI